MPSPRSEIASFRPWAEGVYRMMPGMRLLGADFGNGELDGLALLRDGQFEEYRLAKLEALRHPERHLLSDALTPELEQSVLARLEMQAGDLSEGILEVQEDVAVVVQQTDGTDRCVFLGVCFPSRWAPETKIGRSFFAIHEEIPEMQKVNAAAGGLVEAMVSKGPYVRFVWSLETSDQLDLHPLAAPARDFEHGDLWARVERQVTVPLPEHRAAIFLIRVLRYRVDDLQPQDRRQMAAGISGMSPEVAEYKGLLRDREVVVRRLSVDHP